MNNEVVICVHNRLLLNHKKECIWISSNEVDETRAYYTEWSKSEREIPYTIYCIYMKLRKTVTMILYARHQKRHRCKKQTFELCVRRQGWDDLREKHWNMNKTICKIDDQCKFNAWSRALKAGALGQPRRMVLGGMWEEGSWWRDIYESVTDSCCCVAKKKHHNIVK